MRIGLGTALGSALAAALAAAAAPEPAAAQVTCRPNALGGETCLGLAPPARGSLPYAPRRRGLAGSQDRPGAAGEGPGFAPARRTDRLGNSFLEPDDLPPRRPPLPGVASPSDCRRDALGNLICR